MKRLLITGGMGFVGSALVELLRGKEYEVDIVDNLLSGNEQALRNGIYTPPIAPENVTRLYVTDFYNSSFLKYELPNYDIVVHLAAIVGSPACDVDGEYAYHINVVGTSRLVSALLSHQKLIFTSSTSAYGNQSEIVTEQSKLSPLTNYGVHKKIGEDIVTLGSTPYIIFRPATAFGASHRIRLDLLPNTLCYLALTQKKIELFEPHVIRPFIHVSDFARVIKHAIDDHLEWGEIYNIGDPNLTMRKEQLAATIADLADAEIILKDGNDPDQRNYDVSFEKLLKTGFTFSDKKIQLGFAQIANKLQQLKDNPDSFSTPYNVKMFLMRKGEK